MDALLESWPAELPRIPDLVSAGACYAVGEAAKRFKFAEAKRNRMVRRWLPLVLLAVGAGVRVATEVALGGADIQVALLRGTIAGAAAVYAHNARKAVRPDPEPAVKDKAIPEGEGSK